MKYSFALAFAVMTFGLFLVADAADSVSLAGNWRFALDQNNAGVKEDWQERTLADQITLPGVLQYQGYGDDVATDTKWTATLYDKQWYLKPQYKKYAEPGNVSVPFFLQPPKHYVGAAWYQRDIEIPAEWKGRRVVLTFERAHWETRIWVDKVPVGSNDSLATPHEYDLGIVEPGQHTLTVRVDNRMIVDVGYDAHSITDHTQGNWNGLVGRIELTATSPVWIDDVQTFPNVERKSVRLKVQIGNASGKTGEGTLTVDDKTEAVKWDEKGGRAEFEIALGDAAKPWSEFHPTLQKIAVSLKGDGADDRRDVTFGLREIAVEGMNFTMNGQKFFARGTVENCEFPLTGYPPTDVESWRRVIRICKEHGLNFIRFHSFCPPEAAFIAADELGFYFQVECGMWVRRANMSLGRGKSNDAWLYRESERIVRAYGNHPSFTMLVHGNEPTVDEKFIAAWVKQWKEKDSRRLYSSSTGWGLTNENQFNVAHTSPDRKVPMRGQGGWNGGDFRKATDRSKVPMVTHEIGQFCSYPNFDEMAKYVGPLKPKNFAIFRDSLAEHGMLDLDHAFAEASGKLQTLCYKEEVEAALRTPKLGGFQLLDLHDFPGQGTALVGVLDVFWDSKGYVTPAEFRRFCSETVPLARLTKRTWTTDETLTTEIEISHFGDTPLENAVVSWALKSDDGKVAASGEFPTKTIPLGNNFSLGAIVVPLKDLPAPKLYQLEVSVAKTAVANDWSVWVYPAAAKRENAKEDDSLATPEGLSVTNSFDDATKAKLAAGGAVLYFADKEISWKAPPAGFVPVFWNLQMFPRWKGQTLGILCDPQHPALTEFPTKSYSEWNWSDVLSNCRAFNMDDLPKDMKPIVRMIDDWNRNRRLGIIFECKVGEGRLVACSADLPRLSKRYPAAKQLYRSLLDYAVSEKCKPTVAVSVEQVQSLLRTPNEMRNLGAIASCPQAEEPTTDKVGQYMREDGVLVTTGRGRPTEFIIDDDPSTSWITPAGVRYPIDVIVELKEPITAKGLRCLPVQDSYDGAIKDYVVNVSDDGKTWKQAAKGTFELSLNERTVKFAEPTTARFIKLSVLNGYGEKTAASLAELTILKP